MTGHEDITDETLIILTGNIKSGVHRVFQMSQEEMTKSNGHDVPPLEWAKTLLSILQGFKAEVLNRGLDYKNIQPDISQYEDVWLEHQDS